MALIHAQLRRFFLWYITAFFAVFGSGVLLAHADSISAQQAALQAQLDQINTEITQNQAQLADQQKQRTSLERDVAILDSQIQGAQLEIKQRDLTIKQIKNNILQKEAGITSVDKHVAAGEVSLAQILRETNEMDGTPLVVRVLGGTLKDLLNEADDFASIQKAMSKAFTEMAETRDDLFARKKALEEQHQVQSELYQLQVLQQKSLKAKELQKQELVKAAKGQESQYQKIIAGKQKTAAQVKAALFSLNSASRSTSFGDIYSYAKEAGARTGVRPAFILGILREESDLGQNVGKGNWKVDMHPTRDVPIFAQICAALGLNPDTQPVSKRQSYGWGGAMGPAQFIPSTWKLYADRISAATGQTPADPWDPRTATFATAIYMADLGADVQSGEREAALRYLAGSRWKNPAFAFYGREVLEYAEQYQQDINVLGS